MHNIHNISSPSRLIALLAFAFVLSIGAAPQTAMADDHGEDSELYQKMEAMQDHYRNLGRGLRRPSVEDIPDFLTAVQQLQLLTVQTKVLVPSMTESLPEEERAAFVLAYRKKQVETLLALVQLETVLLEQDFEQADTLFDEIKKHRSEGHEAFKKD